MASFAERCSKRLFSIFQTRASSNHYERFTLFVQEAIQDQDDLLKLITEAESRKIRSSTIEYLLWKDLFAAHCSGSLALSFYEWSEQDRKDAWNRAINDVERFRKVNPPFPSLPALAHLLILLAKNDPTIQKEENSSFLQPALDEIKKSIFPKPIADVYCATARYFCRRTVNSGLNKMFQEALETVLREENNVLEGHLSLHEIQGGDEYLSLVAQTFQTNVIFIIAAISGILSTQSCLPRSEFICSKLKAIEDLSWSLV